jgi:uncharacterized LabA/DUF88 family protein
MRVMVFVDGGYLESNLKKQWGDDVTVNYPDFRESLYTYLHLGTDRGISYVIRIYYYDAAEEGNLPPEQEAKHKKINDTEYFELRLGRLKKHADGRIKQKGVDTLIAIDMVTKAYQNHFDVAVLLAGDDDFLDVVKAVKNAGKQVFGFYFDQLTSQQLKDSFDMKMSIDTNFATQIRTPQRPKRADGR